MAPRFPRCCVGAATVLTAVCVHGQPCTPFWSDQFVNRELDGFVTSLAVFDDGSGHGPAVYAAGSFSASGATVLNHVARLEDHRWIPVGGGIDNYVHVLATFDDGNGPALYAGGYFRQAGGVEAIAIAAWDGTAWFPVGGGVHNDSWAGVHALVAGRLPGGSAELYVGGYFDTAGNVSAINVARWDGTSWSSLGTGLDGYVETLALFDDDGDSVPALYAGGSFALPGLADTQYIARWNGDMWSPVGAGVDGSVDALAVYDDGNGPALYAAGWFDTAGGVVAPSIARWDGVSWSPVGIGTDDYVLELAVFDDGAGPALYAAGGFQIAGGVPASRLARWDGVSWSALGEGVSTSAGALAVLDKTAGEPSGLYVGGNFQKAGPLSVSRVARWDGTAWFDVGAKHGLPEDSGVIALEAFDDGTGDSAALYVGGWLDQAGGAVTNGIAKYDGTTWSSPGGGMTDDQSGTAAVYALEVHDDGGGDALYAGGRFEAAGGAEARHVARWDGLDWSALGGGVGGLGTVHEGVYALESFDDGSGSALYAGGLFVEAGGVPASHIARWDGSEWSALGAGIQFGENPTGSFTPVWALEAYYDDVRGPALYVAGSFNTAGGMPAGSIARWNGNRWSVLRGGVNGIVYALAVFDDAPDRVPALYVAGDFTEAGGVSVSGLARWNGASWSAVPGIYSPGDGKFQIRALAVFGFPGETRPSLYAGGNFLSAGGMTANSIARWHGAYWTALEEGVIGLPLALGGFSVGHDATPTLYVGGALTLAGGLPSHGISGWVGCPADDAPPFTPCRYDVALIYGPGCSNHPAEPYPTGINDAGTVAGLYRECLTGPSRAFRWTPESGLDELWLPSGSPGAAFDINEAGQIVGSFDRSDDDQGSIPYVFADGIAQSLDPPSGAYESAGLAVNNAGHVAGRWSTIPGSPNQFAVVWRDGEVIDLMPDLGAPVAVPGDINDRGQVTGWMGQSISDNHAFIWHNGVVTDLGAIPGGMTGSGNAINNRSQVAVYGRMDVDGGYVFRSFLWERDTWTDLGVLPGFEWTQAKDINEAGVIVGRCSFGSGGGAFVWHAGTMTDLNDLIAWDSALILTSANAINNNGQIAGSGVMNGRDVGVILTPVQAPLGDIDGNCRIDTFDLMILLFEWGKANSPADLDGSGLVDVEDLLMMLGNWTA